MVTSLVSQAVARVGRALLVLRLLTRHRLAEMRGYGAAQAAITHRVDVRRHAAQKWAALVRPGCFEPGGPGS